jgi:hypothetical protein
MEIKSISNLQKNFNSAEPTAKVTQQTAEPSQNQKGIDILQLNDWQRSVVEIALKYLNNKSQMENNHPLSQGRFKQIQTLEEALQEIEAARQPKFKDEALPAQANINPSDVLSLFLQ